MRKNKCYIAFTDTPEERRLIAESWSHADDLGKEFKAKLAAETLNKAIHFWLWLSLFVETVRYILALAYNHYTTGGWELSIRAEVFLSLYWLIWGFTAALLVVGFCIRKHPEKYTDLIIFMGDLYMLIYLVRGVGLAAMEVETGIVGFSMIIALFISSFAINHRPGIALSNMLLTTASFVGTAIAMHLTAFANPIVFFSLLSVAIFSLIMSFSNYHVKYKAFLKEKSLIRAGEALNALNAQLEEKKTQIQMQNEKLQVLSRIDGLTGMRNRHSFVEDCDVLLKRAAKNHSFLTLAIADVDNFKHINDSYGHIVGDECLRTIGEALKLLEEDRVSAYRFGGDEFIVLFNGKSRSEAFLSMNRFLKEISNVHIQGYDGMLSASIGIYSAIPSEQEDMDSFIEKADSAMYEAKNSGKNRIMTSYLEQEKGDNHYVKTT